MDDVADDDDEDAGDGDGGVPPDPPSLRGGWGSLRYPRVPLGPRAGPGARSWGFGDDPRAPLGSWGPWGGGGS